VTVANEGLGWDPGSSKYNGVPVVTIASWVGVSPNHIWIVWEEGSLYYPFGVNPTIQIYGNVQGFPLS